MSETVSMIIERGLFKLDFNDHHAVLGLPIGCDGREARKRYLKIARRLHPDSLASCSEDERQQASQVLSKLVNPAYETLNQEKLANEYDLLLKLKGQQISRTGAPSDVTCQDAQALLTSSNIDADYRQAIKAIATSQYDQLDQLTQAIGNLSELNQVYLFRTAVQGTPPRPAAAAPPSPGSSAAPSPPAAAPPPPPRRSRETIVDSYINRAREFETGGNVSAAILEMRQALKAYPNSAPCHSYLATLYYKGKQAKMASVHAKRALAIDPDNPQAQQLQASLERQGSQGKAAKPAAGKAAGKPEGSGGGFFGLFGGRKK